jgi:hypothetical protein
MALANVAGSYQAGLNTPSPALALMGGINQGIDSIADAIHQREMRKLQDDTNQKIMDFQNSKQQADFKQQSDLEAQKQAGAMALLKEKMAGSNISPADMANKIAVYNQALKANPATPDYTAALGPGGQMTVKQDFTRGEKESQFNQKEWDKIVKETDPLNTSSRTVVGQAAQANAKADRAIVTLQQPIVTNQEAGTLLGDIASIYQGGAPTQFGMSEQQYKTLYGNLQSARQFITGQPQDVMPQAIKTRVAGLLEKLKNVNNGVISNHLDYLETAKAKIIKAFPDEWKNMRSKLERGQKVYGDGSQSPSGQSLPAGAGTGGQQGQVFNVNGKQYNIPSDQVDEFKKDMGLQ